MQSIDALISAYYEQRPDTDNAAERVSFGISGR